MLGAPADGAQILKAMRRNFRLIQERRNSLEKEIAALPVAPLRPGSQWSCGRSVLLSKASRRNRSRAAENGPGATLGTAGLRGRWLCVRRHRLSALPCIPRDSLQPWPRAGAFLVGLDPGLGRICPCGL